MFYAIKGQIREKTDDCLLVEVKGLGFLIRVSEDLLVKSRIGEEVELYTSVILKGDVFEIYGFEDFQDRQLFDVLRTIDSVGPRLAFRIISKLGKRGILDAVNRRNSSVFESVEGIGRKTASKILLDLTGKLEKIAVAASSAVPSDNIQAARSALEQLGLTKAEISECLSEINFANAGTVEEIVQEALKIYREKKKL